MSGNSAAQFSCKIWGYKPRQQRLKLPIIDTESFLASTSIVYLFQNFSFSVLTEDDLEYMESYGPVEIESPTFCNLSTMTKEVVVNKEVRETLCNLYHIKVKNFQSLF